MKVIVKFKSKNRVRRRVISITELLETVYEFLDNPKVKQITIKRKLGKL